MRDLAQIRAGYQIRGRVEAKAGGTHWLLQLRDFDEERTRICTDDMVRVSPGRTNDQQVLRDGDLVFLAKGARNFAFVPRHLPGPLLVAPYFFLIRPGELVDPDYLAWFLNLDSTRALLARVVGRGTAMPVVRREYLEDLEVPLPPLERQRAIAKLDDLARQRQRLTTDLAGKQRLLVTAACMRAADRATKEQAD